MLTRLVFFCVLFVCCNVALAAELVYHQKSGKLELDGKVIDNKSYSGFGNGKNNPDKEKVKNVGPIPVGEYKLGKSREYKKMADCFDLVPVGHDAYGRTEFMIHGESKSKPGTASEGCIIASPDARKKIAEAKVTKLLVVKD